MAIKSWIEAFRLRTLPLALASVGLGSFIAASHGQHRTAVTLLTLLTSILLQILSNLANDYGDYMNGADTADRIGPRRAVASGDISPAQMKTGIIIFVILCLASGLSLLWISFNGNINYRLLGFFVLGLLCIGAAIKYTAGKNPYGYRGLGDIAVFIFFGPVAVAGTYFLHTGQVTPQILLPATAFGLLSTGVLNVNNLRDYTSDRDTGKRTIVVQLGPVKGLQYHIFLLVTAWICLLWYTALNYQAHWNSGYLILLPMYIRHVRQVKQLLYSNPPALTGQLKMLALSNLLLVLVFGLFSLI